MKKQRTLLKLMGCCLVASSALMISCQDIADDDHYKSPDWLKGNAWQVMQAEGNYTSMLKAVELTGYKPLVNGQTILTVMAADDAAWQSYLQQLGYESVDDMYQRDPKLLKKTVGYHLVYYAYDWQKFVNFRPNEGDGATADQLAQNAGMWFKHRTRSQDDMEQMRGRLNAVDTTVTVYHYERFLPVFSGKYFETRGIDAKTNYEYFYPQSTWTGGSNGFNVSNASVTDEQAVVTDNGYLYHVNQVVRPLETIYQQLKQNPNYSDFISLYDQYAEFTQASQETIENVGHTVYQLSHGSLPPIAWEWPVSDYRQMSSLSRSGYNIFAPSNQAIQQFFKDYWMAENGYATLSDLDPLVMQYFVRQSFADERQTIVFPEDIRNEKVQTEYGTPININPDEVDDHFMCANGVVYGMSHMDPPAIFSSVVGPAFADTTYQCYLYTLDKSDLVLALASNKTEFVTLIPTNLQYNQNEPQMRLNTTSAGRLLEVYSDVDAAFAAMGQTQARSIVNLHTAAGISELPTTGLKVVETNEAFNYWFVRDGMITTNARFNEQLNPAYEGNPFVPLHEITIGNRQWDNGRAYGYDAEGVFAAVSGDGVAQLLVTGNDKNYEYYLFAQLLQKAGLVVNGDLPTLVSEGNRLIVFVPTNEAIRQNLAEIPGCSALSIADDYTLTGTVSTANQSLLAAYLRSYFVSSLMNSFSSYPYPGSTCKGSFLAMSGERVEIADDGSRQLSFGYAAGAQIPVIQKYSCLPFAFSDGCMQLIDGILK